MSVEYLDRADYIAIATAVTGLDLQTVMNMTNHDLADSALHAPAAGVGDTDFSPEFIDKAAVLVVRLARNHQLPDGNKRAAWVSLRLFVDTNDWTWMPTPHDTHHAPIKRGLPCGRGTANHGEQQVAWWDPPVRRRRPS